MQNKTNNTGIDDQSTDLIRSVFARTPSIQKVILYGSRAMGNFRDGSDIDLTIIGDTVTVDDLYTVDCALDNLLLPWKIDLSLMRMIQNEKLLDHINRVGVVLFEKA